MSSDWPPLVSSSLSENHDSTLVSWDSSSLPQFIESPLISISLSEHNESALVSRVSSILSEAHEFGLASISLH